MKTVSVPMPPPAGETQAEKSARWKREDELSAYGAKTGNPFATLCDNCMGRHWSPKDKECPHPKYIRKA